MQPPHKPPARPASLGRPLNQTSRSERRELVGANVSIVPAARSTFAVNLEGFFRPTWMTGLSAGLAERKISVERVEASAQDGWWQAALHIATPEGLDPNMVPYAALVEDAPQVSHEGLRIQRYRLSESGEYGGTLCLEIDAEDSLGLLGRVLSLLAMLSLFPVSMHIETRGGRAHDRFWLSGMGRAAPSDHARSLLKRMLAGVTDEVSEQTVVAQQFADPTWDAPFDERAELRAIPETATISGMFPQSLVLAAERRKLRLRSAREHYLPFEFYPVVEHAELLVQAARLFLPEQPLRAALRVLGRSAPDALLSTTLGRMVLGTAQGTSAAVHAMAHTYSFNIRPNDVSVAESDDGGVVVRFRQRPFFFDSHHVGVFEGAMRYAGVNGQVLVREGALGSELSCSWASGVVASKLTRR